MRNQSSPFFLIISMDCRQFAFFSKVLSISFLFILLASGTMAQNRTVRGKVTDDKNKPLTGVSVLVKGTKNGTNTNAQGEFELKDVKNDATLVISRISFEPKEIKLVAGIDFLNVVMNESITKLTDIVVTGFQQISKKTFTGAGVKLKAEDV